VIGLAGRYAKLARMTTKVRDAIEAGIEPVSGEYEWRWRPGARRREHKLATINAWAEQFGGKLVEDGATLRASCQVSSRLLLYWTLARDE
jgi:hypothetical protein